jgi:serine/threonine protein kinase/FKBP-type peptidyl-prolyl cis-trans isomerase/formylglycine-generating enzyme required for sulfatase activity
LNDQSRGTELNDSQVAAALREYLERVDRGEPVDREAFLARHALIADKLRSFIAAEDEVRKLAGAQTPLDSTKSFVAHGQETIAPQSVAMQNDESGGSGLTGQFGRYRIIRVLGKGAMGAVYLAEDTQLERSVAIKTPHFTESPTEESLERFYREARVAATLRQPNICPVHDVGQIDGKHYISMAYIEGRPLSAFIKPDKSQTERQILIAIRKLAIALQEAHDHGIVHRDLKPANIMVDKKGEPIIMDFGLAQQARHEGDIRLTQTGNIIGTPAYMSPEQVEGEPDKIGPATDQYSLGVILYELLTAQLPFRGSVIAVMGQILTKDVAPPSQMRPDLDPRIEAVCLKMMAKTPSGRFASLKAVADELATILKSPAAKAVSEEQPASTPAGPSSDRLRADVGASQVLKSLKPKALTESDLASLEELARKCLARRDYEQVIQVIERIPEEKRNVGLVALLEKSRAKVDEVSFLICDIDEADRLNDARTALKKAEALLKIKPGHHRALEAQEKYSRHGDGGAGWIGVLDQFRRPLNDGGWIPWSALAFGLAVFGVMAGVIVIYLGRTAVVIDIQDPGVEVALKGTTLTVTGPDKQSVKVVPGDQELTITCAGLEIVTKSFTIKKGEKKTVTVSIVDSKLVARFENEIAPTSTHEEQASSPTTSGKNPLPPLTPAHDATTTAALPPTFKNSLGMEFVLVPKGKSWLGGGGGKPGDKEVEIADDFYLGKYEVTQEEWEKATGVNPSHFSRTGGGQDMVNDIPDAELKRFPVEQVSWDDVQLFLERLNKGEKETGWVYRLPNEAEWEYACRGGPPSDRFESAYDFYFDKPTNQLSPEQGNFEHGNGLKRTCKVGSYQPNRLGLYDMHGNVYEWCEDAENTADGFSHAVRRSGCWHNDSRGVRAVSRYVNRQSDRHDFLGLRVARVPAGKEHKESTPSLAADGFVPLLNGKDLTGWKTHPSQPGNWRVVNGILTGSGPSVSHLYTDRGNYENFHLRLETRVNDGGNSGVYFRAPFGPTFPANDPRWLAAYNAKIDKSRFGGLIVDGAFGRPLVRNQVPLFQPGQWITLEVVVQASRIEIKINGATTADYTDQERHYSRGHIVLQQHGPKTVAEFRKIEIKELSPISASTAPSPPAVGPTPNVATTAPKSLGRASSVQGEWTIENDELVQSSLAKDAERPLLIFGDANWSNFDLTLHAKKTGGRGSVDFFFHCLIPGIGRSFQFGSKDNTKVGTGYKYNDEERNVAKQRAFKTIPDRWYVIKLEVRGGVFRFFVDGILQFKEADPRFTHGLIGFGTWDATARFRDVKVTDPAGKVLWEGLLDLAAQASGRTESGVEAPALEKMGISRAETNQKKGEEFLAANAKKKGVKTLPSGLQYVVVKEGTGKLPKETDEVEVHYRGTLIDGTVFDNSVDGGKPVSFRLNRVIPGWTEALQLMKKGAKWRVFIPSKLAYRQEGVQPKIGPNETLIFEIELLHVK